MTSPFQYHYGKFPPKNIDWLRLILLIGPANAALAASPNSSILLAPLTTQEAVLSLKIEGTQATMGEVFEFEAEGGSKDLPQKKKADINEVLNYRKAMRHAEGLLNTLPLCQRVIEEAAPDAPLKKPALFRFQPSIFRRQVGEFHSCANA